jgi:hypothetical protein
VKKRSLLIFILGFAGILASVSLHAQTLTYDELMNNLDKAIVAKDLAQVKYWVGQKADVNGEPFNNYSPLWRSAKVNFPEVMDFLVENDAEINQTSNAETPLNVAFYQSEGTPKSRLVLIKKILSLGIDPTLYYSVPGCFTGLQNDLIGLEALELLLEYGLDPYELLDSYELPDTKGFSTFEYLEQAIKNPRGPVRDTTILEKVRVILEKASKTGPYAMIRDLEKKILEGKDIHDVVKSDPELYSQSNVEKLIDFALKRAVLARSRDMLSKANLLIQNMDNDVLSSRLNSAENFLTPPKLKIFNKIITATLHIDLGSEKENLAYALKYMADELNGKIGTVPLSKITLGTPLCEAEDSLFYQASILFANDTSASMMMNKLRLEVLCNNEYLIFGDNNILGYRELAASEITSLSFIMGYDSKNGISLEALTKNSFKDLKLEIPQGTLDKGLKMFDLINDNLTLKK